jgi:hypothetical protein
MAFNLMSWWHRQRVLVEVTMSGREVQTHRVTNPYHAVSIKAGPSCVQTKLKYGSRRFLSAEAPPLPLPTCDVTACICQYAHHDDRRAEPDRRLQDVWNPNARLAEGGDRRRLRGRRVTDH